MTKNLFKILIYTFCLSDTSLASSVTLPQPTGPYAVGTQAIELKDETRRMLRDSSARRWAVQAFYPAVSPKGQTFLYMPETLKGGMIIGVKVLAHSKPNALIAKEGPFPLIFFIPGFGEVRQSYTILCEELASQGFVVLSLDQPYVSSFVKFPNRQKTIVPTFYDAWKTPRDRDYRYRYYDEAMEAAIHDIRYMLNHLNSLNQGYFSDQLDTSQLILMGHSFGGNVAHTLGFADPRIQAVVDIDSKITEKKIYGRVGVPPNPQAKPALFIRAIMQYQEEVGDQLTKIPHAETWSPQVQHSAFRDMAYLTRRIPGLAQPGMAAKTWNWFWKIGPLFDAIDTGVGDQHIDQWVEVYRATIVGWLNVHLRSRREN